MKKPFSVLPQVAALSMLAAIALPAAAQSAGSNVLSVGWFHIAPNDSSEPLTQTYPARATVPGSSASIDNTDTLGIAFTHFYSDHVAVTFDAGIPPKFKLQGGGTLAGLGELGTAKQWSPAVVAKWYFGDANSQFRPFVGAGVAYVRYSDVELSGSLQRYLTGGAPGGRATADLDSSWAPVASVGASYNFDKHWSLGLSVSYLPLKTRADITATVGSTVVSRATTELTIDPVVTFLSVGYKF